MDVIGAGLGRTGTLSFKTALERLGFSPCYHIEDMLAAGQLDEWERLAAGAEIDWATLFGRYRASSDFPACLFFREQAEAFPDAKVVLTTREPLAWAVSVQALRAFNLRLRERSDMQTPLMQRWGAAIDALTWDRLGDIDDTANLVRFFDTHTNAVMDAIPAQRLLIFDVRSGWEPLCAFLGLDVPAEPFPRVNERGALDDMLAAEPGTIGQSLRRGHGED